MKTTSTLREYQQGNYHCFETTYQSIKDVNRILRQLAKHIATLTDSTYMPLISVTVNFKELTISTMY